MHEDVHARIVDEAIRLLGNSELEQGKERIVYGCRHEDYFTVFGRKFYTRVRTHFYSHKHGRGLFFFRDAMSKGQLYFRKAIKLYAKGRKHKSFEYLGRCAHLLEDMAVPAHSNLIPHLRIRDALEVHSQKNSLPACLHSIIVKENVRDYFYELASLSSGFESYRADGLLSPTEGQHVAYQHGCLLSEAIGATASLLMHFMMEVENANRK